MRLRLHPGEFVVARTFDAPVTPPGEGIFFASIQAFDGNTIVCPSGHEPKDADVERGWRLLQIDEPLGFTEIGVLASVVGPLAAAGVAVFVISSFASDWILIREPSLPLARATLRATGHTLES